MRHHVQPATSADVAYLAARLEDGPVSLDWPEKDPGRRLLEACAFSTQIWAARRLSDGATSALWGVTPRLDNPDVGYVWMLTTPSFDDDPRELSLLCRLVLGEMLDQFPRLEQQIDARHDRALNLLRGLGFIIGKARRDLDSSATLHRVWLDSAKLRNSPSDPGGTLLH
ncbi:hypothetical protein [uncultured Reyranella sp.]|jgi:hypothetical protein|uniref:hypothetical protein n=1 Tax=uncultured Reyranella sp. TaxID=735512 RepID=UPI00259D1316|nr:hypothetical protein [uncultured Reyranella sp.]